MEIASYPRTIAGSVRRVDTTRTLKRKQRDEKKVEVKMEGRGWGGGIKREDRVDGVRRG